MSIKRQAIRGVAVNLIGVAVAFGVTFFSTPILIRQLGDARYGLWAIVCTFGAYYAMAQLGIGPAATKYIAQYEAKHDRESTLRTIATAFCIHLPMALLVVIAATGLSAVLADIFEIEPQYVDAARTMTILMGCSAAVMLLSHPFDATLTALRQFALNSLLNTIQHALMGGLAIYLMLAGYGLVPLAASVLIVTTIIFLARAAFAIRGLGCWPLRLCWVDRQHAKKLFGFGLLGTMQSFANQGSLSSGTIIIGIICGPAMVVYYSISQSFQEKLHQLCVTIGVPLMPIASALDSQDRHDDLAEAYTIGTRVLLSITLAFVIALIAIGHPFIDLWIEPGYGARAYPVLCIIACAMIPSAIRQGSVAILRGKNQMRALAIIGAAEFATVVVSGIVATWLFGIVGMALAFLTAKWIYSGIMLPVACCRELKMGMTNYWTRAVLVPIAGCTPAVLIAIAMAILLSPSSLWQVLLQAAVIAMISLGTAFFVIFDRKLQREILSAVGINRQSPSPPPPSSPDSTTTYEEIEPVR